MNSKYYYYLGFGALGIAAFYISRGRKKTAKDDIKLNQKEENKLDAARKYFAKSQEYKKEGTEDSRSYLEDNDSESNIEDDRGSAKNSSKAKDYREGYEQGLYDAKLNWDFMWNHIMNSRSYLWLESEKKAYGFKPILKNLKDDTEENKKFNEGYLKGFNSYIKGDSGYPDYDATGRRKAYLDEDGYLVNDQLYSLGSMSVNLLQPSIVFRKGDETIGRDEDWTFLLIHRDDRFLVDTKYTEEDIFKED